MNALVVATWVSVAVTAAAFIAWEALTDRLHRHCPCACDVDDEE